MSIFKDPETGQWMELVGSQMRPLEGINPDQMEIARRNAEGSGKLETFGMGIANAAGAGWWGDWESPEQYQANMQALQEKNPWSYTGGNMAAAIPAAVAGGGSIAGTAALEAGMGALGNRNNPVEGAAWGAGLGAAGAGLGRGFDAFKNAGTTMSERVAATVGKAKGVANSVADAVPDSFAPRSMMAAAPGTSSRIGSKIVQQGAGAEEGSRVMRGMLTPEEAEKVGLPLTMGDQAALASTTKEARTTANQIRGGEELRRTDKFGVGAGIEAVRDEQKMFGTDFIKKQLDIEGAEQLTPASLGGAFDRMGKQFDDFAEQIGAVEIGDDVLDAMSDIVEEAPTNYSAAMQKIHKDVVDQTARNNGVLDASQWQQIRTRLSKMIESGTRQGDYSKVSDASAMQEVLQDTMENSLGAEGRAQMAQLRKQYGLAKTLASRPGIIDGEGLVNPRSFMSAYMGRSVGKLRNAEADDIARTFGTLRFLNDKITPSSGTAERIIANPVGKAASLAPIPGAGVAAAYFMGE